MGYYPAYPGFYPQPSKPLVPSQMPIYQGVVPSLTQPVQTQPAQAQPAQAQPAQAQPAQAQPAQAQPTQAQPAQAQLVKAQSDQTSTWTYQKGCT